MKGGKRRILPEGGGGCGRSREGSGGRKSQKINMSGGLYRGGTSLGRDGKDRGQGVKGR